MTQRNREQAKVTSSLRHRAEQWFHAHLDEVPTPAPEEVQQVVHELGVRTIELEMQNEELRSAQQELEAAHQRYADLFEFAPVGYTLLDAQGILQQINLTGAGILGVERSHLVGAPLIRYVAGKDRREFLRHVQQCIQEGGPVSCDLTLLRRDGRAVVVQLQSYRFDDPQEQSLCRTAIIDITQRRALEETLKESDRRKDEFLAMLGHELRNPLAGIVNGIEVLKMLGAKTQDAEEMREVIQRQASHMAHLIDDLLDVSRISRGKIQLRKHRLDLVELTRKAVESYRHGIQDHGLALALELPTNPLWVQADPTRLAQVLGNLLSNACKFTDPGGRISVTMQVDPDRSTASITIRDTGIGMEPRVLRRLFEPFGQADNSLDRSRGGLGLGLALAKGLVEMHGGEMTASSPGLGRGSEFCIRLPIAEESREGQSPTSEAATSVKSYRILLIDDRRDAILPLRKMLTILGQQVAMASDGRSGLEKAQEFLPEIVLCDIGLPDLNGYEVAQAMRTDRALRSAYLVAVTGYGQEEDRRRAIQAGFDYHITKPVSKEQLEMLLAQQPGSEYR